MQILVQVDKTYTLDVNPHDTIEQIKLQIEDKSAISASLQRLIFGLKELKNNHTLSKYNISHLSIINVVQSLPIQPPISFTINISLIASMYCTHQKGPLLTITCDPYITLEILLNKIDINMDFIQSKCLQISVVHKYFNLETILTQHQICNNTLLNIDHILDERLITIQSPPIFMYDTSGTIPSSFIRQIRMIFTSNKTPIRSNKIELDIISQIALCMKHRKFDDLLLYESALCIFHFTELRICHFAQEAKCINKFILPSILDTLIKNKCTENTKCVLFECIINVISHSDRFWIYEHREFCLNNNIVIILRNYCSPNENQGKLVLLSEIIYYLCNCTKIIETETYLEIIEFLYILMYYEDNSVVIQNTLNAFSTLINISHGNQNILNNILSNKYNTKIKQIYENKKIRDRLIFNGYIHYALINSNIQFIPNDIAWIIFNYFNCYNYEKNIEIDIIKRLIFLFDINNGYVIGVKNTSLTTVQRITQFCSLEILDSLVFKYHIWKYIKDVLNMKHMNFSMYEVYWIANHISYGNFESLWISKTIKTMIDRFKNENINISIDLVMPLFDVIMDNFNYNAFDIVDDGRLNTIVVEYKLIEGLLNFIKNYISCDTMNDNQSISKAFDLMEFLLFKDEIIEVCIQEIKKYNGYNILKQIIEKPHNINNTQIQRVRNIFNNYVESKSD